MAYHAPSLSDLLRISAKLAEYQGKNPQRISFSALYSNLTIILNDETLPLEKVMNILMGALVYELTLIKHQEYKGKSPKFLKGYVFNSGSRTYTDIKEALRITALNKMGYDERLFYLNEFYKYIQYESDEKDFAQLSMHPKIKHQIPLAWENKEQLCVQIKTAMQSVYTHNQDYIHRLIYGIPLLSGLLKNLAAIDEQHAAQSSDPNNKQRVFTKRMFGFIAESSQKKCPIPLTEDVCCGAILMTLLEIETAYSRTSWFGWGPTHSTMYNLCLKALNQPKLDNIPLEVRCRWLNALYDYLNPILSDQATNVRIATAVCSQLPNAQTEATTLCGEMIKFRKTVHTYWSDLEQQRGLPSHTSSMISSGTGYLFGYVASQAAQSLIIGGLGAGGLLLAGPAGQYIFSGTGKLLWTGLGQLVSETALEVAAASMIAWCLARIGYTLGSVAANALLENFTATPDGLIKLLKNLPAKDQIVFVQFVNTLLEIDLVTEEEKASIRKVIGLSESEMMPYPEQPDLSAQEIRRQELLLRYGDAAIVYNSQDSVLIDPGSSIAGCSTDLADMDSRQLGRMLT